MRHHPIDSAPARALSACLLLGCAASAPDPDAGSVPADAGRSDSGLVLDTGTTVDSGPTVDAGSSALHDGARRTLTGTGFGERDRAMPILYADFESGADGSPIGAPWRVDAAGPTHTADERFGGSQSGHVGLPGPTIYLTELGLDEAYVSYRVRVHEEDHETIDGPQIKMFRFTSADIDYLHGALDTGMTYQGHIGGGGTLWYSNAETFYGPDLPEDQWVRVEHYLRLSAPAGAANGERWSKIDYSGDMTYSGSTGHFADPEDTGIGSDQYRGGPIVTRSEANAALHIENAVMPMFTRPQQEVDIWIDEVLVDSTQARVEIGDAPTWSACTDRSPQPTSVWSDTEIEITLNRGRLSGEAYVFVVTASGEILELGALGSWD